ncbi:MAG: hypothetical protein M3P51_09655 [Chloroflexota bacterium]|nr:hypothetical protein [Chloroflexota bacterium]
MPAVGLKRAHDLRGYTGDALALLTRRERAYGYRHTERFLSAVARADGADTLTDALAQWAARLWHPGPRLADASPPAYYVDGHRKAVHSDKLIPRGLVSRYGKVLGCRALMLLHDEQGHPLLATTSRGDTHLTAGLPSLVERYEQLGGGCAVQRVVVDREGMAAAFLARLRGERRDVVTVLRSNQYEGLESFTDIGEFVPLSRDRQGKVTREVAPARCFLPLPDDPDGCLELRVALVRDLRRRIPRASKGEEGSQPEPHLDSPSWFEDGWVATPTPVVTAEPALVPIVTTASEVDPVELTRTYTHRWPAQENIIRDWLLPLGLDTNHGYAKTPVPNSEMEKKRATLEKRLVNAKRWGERARSNSIRASKTSSHRWKRAKVHSREAYSELNDRLFAMEAEGLPPCEYRAWKKDLVAAVEAEMEGYWRGYYRSVGTCNSEYAKWERYCREQRDLLRALEDLKSGERQMYELDDSKDQVMTALKLALANLAMWVRDNYFPAEYAHATWQRLVPFFRLPGWVALEPDAVRVRLRAFNGRGLSLDLVAICERVAGERPRLPGAGLLVFEGPEAHRLTRATRGCHIA